MRTRNESEYKFSVELAVFFGRRRLIWATVALEMIQGRDFVTRDSPIVVFLLRAFLRLRRHSRMLGREVFGVYLLLQHPGIY